MFKSCCSNARCAIPGLEGRQFQFLGLMDCPHEACERENIPAEKVREIDLRSRLAAFTVKPFSAMLRVSVVCFR